MADRIDIGDNLKTDTRSLWDSLKLGIGDYYNSTPAFSDYSGGEYVDGNYIPSGATPSMQKDFGNLVGGGLIDITTDPVGVAQDFWRGIQDPAVSMYENASQAVPMYGKAAVQGILGNDTTDIMNQADRMSANSIAQLGLLGLGLADVLPSGKVVNRVGDVIDSLPKKRFIPNYGEISIKPNAGAEQAAIDHSVKSGIPYNPLNEYAPIDKDFAAKVAHEYELMKHDPSNKLVQESYGAMRDQMYGQYEEMLRQGIKPEFNSNPYSANPWEALADMQENKRLLVYPTNDGFGTSADFDPSTNPLLAKSPYKFNGQDTLDNDIFRAVHDYQGHAKQGVGFRGRGEENAFQSHAGTFDPLARKALASETRGQNSWLNYGPYGEHNRTASVLDTKFADQKTGLLPNWVVEKDGVSQKHRQAVWNELVKTHRTGLEGAISADGTITLNHYSPANIETGRVDPSYYGGNLSGQTRAEKARSYDADFVPRTFWGVDAADNPYKKEGGLGNNQYVAKINGADIYDAQKDTDKLWDQGNATKSEKEIWKAGHSGYIVNHSKLGRVVQLFDPVDATKKLIIPLAGAGLLAGGAMNNEPKEQPQGLLY